jgi:glyoxylase-like metal-dependent hydrolase (beta-lactamase superfamily II)
MRIHHLNCGTMCPFGGRLMTGRASGPARLVCHCLLIETDGHGLVLIDTGLGLRDVRSPTPRLSRFFLTLLRLPLKEEETALRQIEGLGFVARDVRHIVITHLDFDHAGGIEDFPEATVHVMSAEARAAKARHGMIAHGRYRPQQWDEISHWEHYESQGESWFGFECVRDLKGLPPEVLLIPLIGHTWGHAGVAVRRPEGWLLHAGDAYFHEREMHVTDPGCPPGLRAYQTMMEVDRKARLANQERLRALARTHGESVRIVCAHDTSEFARCAANNPPSRS